MHVVHVIGSLNRGGAETVSLDICRAIPTTEVRQTFVTVGGREGSLASAFRAAGASVTQCPLIPAATFPWRMWRCLRRLQPDVVVSHLSLFTAVVLALAWAAGVQVRIARMWSEADGQPDTPARLVRRALFRRLLRRIATNTVGVSTAALEFAGRHDGEAGCQVLFNSVDLTRVEGWNRTEARRRWGLPEDVPVVAYLGRASPVKNRSFLIPVHRAFRRLSPDARLLVVGPLGVEDIVSVHPGAREDVSVTFGGETDEIASVLAAADALVLPSLWEGLPGVVLEAVAFGLPVVATDLACLREASGYVKGLTLLSLAAGPDRWAEALSRSVSVSAAEREAIRLSFSASPFRVEHAAAQWRSLWLRTGGGTRW